jgi:phospholipase/carboxylesterase
MIVERGVLLENASHALIALHGRGASAESIIPLARELAGSSYYIAAPASPNDTWSPYSFMEKEALNEPYVTHAVRQVKNILDQVTAVVPLKNIVIMGFSQGACLALEVAARYPARYKGVAAFTGGLIGSVLDKSKYHGEFKGTPIFIGNSDQDPHVPLERSEDSKNLLTELGAKVTLKVYPGMAHSVNQDEIDWVKNNIINSDI